MNRRTLIAAAPLAALAVAGCAFFKNPQGGVTLDKAKAYASDLNGALHQAASVFTASPQATADQKALVAKVLADLDTANAAFQAAQVVTDAKSIAQQVIAFAQQIVPIVAPFAGAAGPYFALALAVLQAFVADLPSSAPTTPPAALHRAALAWHGHGR